jgi:hypothetical protein
MLLDLTYDAIEGSVGGGIDIIQMDLWEMHCLWT